MDIIWSLGLLVVIVLAFNLMAGGRASAILRPTYRMAENSPLLSKREVIRKIGRDAGLELSPHTLRHTCLTALVRKQNDIILVADIAGHKSLNTTKRYTLPTAADKAKALEQLLE